MRSRQRQDLGLRRLWGGRTQPLKPYREEGAARGRESPTSPTPRAPGAGHTAAQEHLLRGYTRVTRLQRSDPRRGLRASSPHYHGGVEDNDAGGQRAVDKGAQDFPPQETNEETCHGEQRGHQRQTRIRERGAAGMATPTIGHSPIAPGKHRAGGGHCGPGNHTEEPGRSSRCARSAGRTAA